MDEIGTNPSSSILNSKPGLQYTRRLSEKLPCRMCLYTELAFPFACKYLNYNNCIFWVGLQVLSKYLTVNFK